MVKYWKLILHALHNLNYFQVTTWHILLRFYSQRLELQQRLLRQAYDEAKSSGQLPQTQRSPLELSEQFVHKYNIAGPKVKEKLHDKAEKMLQRSKVTLY